MKTFQLKEKIVQSVIRQKTCSSASTELYFRHLPQENNPLQKICQEQAILIIQAKVTNW